MQSFNKRAKGALSHRPLGHKPHGSRRIKGYNPISIMPATGRDLLRRIVLGTILTVLILLALVFAADFLVFRIRVATNRNPYGSVTVNRYYAVAQKNGKTQFIFDPPQPETCVHALFPHSGSKPCWYLSRHTDERTEI